MVLEKHKFQSYTEEEERNKGDLVFSVKLNKIEQPAFFEAKKIINQPKNSTAIKMLAELGAKVILEEKTRLLINIILGNKRKNERTGALIE